MFNSKLRKEVADLNAQIKRMGERVQYLEESNRICFDDTAWIVTRPKDLIIKLMRHLKVWPKRTPGIPESVDLVRTKGN